MTLAFVAILSQGSVARAEPVSEVTGNWSGSAGGGFHFRATLEQVADSVTLTIWNGVEDVPSPGAGPDLAAPDFALSAFATNRLEVVETPDGSILQVTTDFADETAEGREVVSVRFIDFQYTVTGYSHRAEHYLDGGETAPYACEIDLLTGEIGGNGRPHNPPPVAPQNASSWRYSTAFDLGWCSVDSPGWG